MNTYELQGVISLDTSEYEKKLEEAKNKFLELQNQIQGNTLSISTSFSGAAQSVSGLLSMFGGFANVSSTIGAVGGTIGVLGIAVTKTTETFKNFGENIKKVLEEGIETGEKFAEVIGGSIVKSTQFAVDSVKDVASVLGSFGGKVIQSGMGFEASTSKVMATMMIDKDTVHEKTGENIYELLVKASEIAGETTKFSPQESMDALGEFALKGYGGDKGSKVYEMTDLLNPLLDVAVAGNISLPDAARYITTSINVLGLKKEKEEVEHLGNLWAKTASNSGTELWELGEAFVSLGSMSKAVKGGALELSTAFGILADAGRTGSEAGHTMRNIISSLSGGKAAKTLAEDYGISTLDANGDLRPINEIFKELNKAIAGKGSGEKQNIMTDMFNAFDKSYALTLVEQSGDRWDELSGTIEDCDGAIEGMAKRLKDNLSGAITIFKSQAESFMDAIYKKIQKPVRDIVEFTGDSIIYLKNGFESGDFTGIAVRLGSVIDNIFKTFTEKASGIPAAVSDFVSQFVRGIKNRIPQIAENVNIWITEIFKSGSSILESLLKGINDKSAPILSIGETLINSLMDSFVVNSEIISEYAPDIITKLAESVVENTPRFVRSIKTVIANLSGGIVEVAPELVETGAVLVEGLIDIMGASASATSKIVRKISDSLITKLSDEEFSGNIRASIHQIIESLGGITESVVDVITEPSVIDTAKETFEGVLGDITSVIDGLVPVIMPKLTKLAKELGETIKDSTAFLLYIKEIGLTIGTQITLGFIAGIGEAIKPSLPKGASNYVEQLGEAENDMALLVRKKKEYDLTAEDIKNYLQTRPETLEKEIQERKNQEKEIQERKNQEKDNTNQETGFNKFWEDVGGHLYDIVDWAINDGESKNLESIIEDIINNQETETETENPFPVINLKRGAVEVKTAEPEIEIPDIEGVINADVSVDTSGLNETVMKNTKGLLAFNSRLKQAVMPEVVIDKTDVEIPEIAQPEIPKADINIPEIKQPEIEMPEIPKIDIAIPETPEFDISGITDNINFDFDDALFQLPYNYDAPRITQNQGYSEMARIMEQMENSKPDTNVNNITESGTHIGEININMENASFSEEYTADDFFDDIQRRLEQEKILNARVRGGTGW